MIETYLFTYEAGHTWKPRGPFTFQFLPRIGEHIELTGDGTPHAYRVVGIHHPEETTGKIDIYVALDGTKEDVLLRTNLPDMNKPRR